MVLHEMGVSQRLPVLREMQRLARNLVLVDYRVPPPANLAAVICRIIERLAGNYHYRNYLSFTKDGGSVNAIGDPRPRGSPRVSFPQPLLAPG